MQLHIAALAAALALQPNPAALEPIYRQALEEREKEFGPKHPKVARSAADLGLFLRNHGDRAAAAPYLRRALAIDEKALGPESLVVGEDLENLASVLPPREALPLYQRAGDHKDAGLAARNLAKVASYEEARGDFEAALALYRRALAKEEAASGAGHARVGVRLNDVALLVAPKEAEPLLRRALTIQEKALGGRHPETAATLNNLANVLLGTGRVTQAEPLARRALSILEDTLGPNHPRVAIGASNLADMLRAKKDYANARGFYERALAIDEKAYGPNHPEVAVDLANLAGLLEEMGRPEEARPLRERAAAIKAAR
ncbi:MAG: tetratricopeptide repeat protein [Bryobacteraceae bacterium]